MKIYAIIAGFLLLITGTIAEAQTTTSTTTPNKIERMSAGCSIRVNALRNGTAQISWTADADNTNGRYPTFSWSGTTSTSTTFSETVSSGGLKQATVIVRSGDQTIPLTCSALIQNIATSTTDDPLSGRCKANPSGLRVSWSSAANGGGNSSTTYSWSGTDGLVGTTSSVGKQYTTEGVKEGRLVIQKAAGDRLELTCQAYVASSSGCFIATAAFGSEMEPHVATLRKFRDEKLLTNTAGKKFVETYYEYSPGVADYIRDKEILKAAVRAGLKPITYLLE